MISNQKKKVLAIPGSLRNNSSNLQIIKAIKKFAFDKFDVEIYNDTGELPHFNPDLDNGNTPEIVVKFRDKINEANGVLICTPEYVFSLPGSLKNALEWTVSTTIFSGKPVALITASGLGGKAHEALQLIMKTIDAKFDNRLQLLISGARSKLDENGNIKDENTMNQIKELIFYFEQTLHT